MHTMQLNILIVCLISMISCRSQTDCRFTEKGIPLNNKYYMIGETHLDNVQKQKNPAEMEFINRVLACEDTIRNFLSESCNVNNYIIEGQVWIEYFFNKYLLTGDEYWLDLFNNNEYQQGKIKSIAKIAATNKNIKVSCIDYDYKKYYSGVIKTLFCLSFYEKYPELFTADSKTQVTSPAYNNIALAKSQLAFDSKSTVEVKKFLQFIIAAYENNSNSTADSLFIFCEKYLNNELLSLEIDRYFDINSNYITRLLSSYYYGYKMNTDSMNDLRLREEMMFANLDVLEYLYPNDIFCLQMGANHLMPEENFDVIRYKIAAKEKKDPYCFYIIPLGKEKWYADYIQNINFSYTGVSCYKNYSANESYYLIK